MGVCWCVLAAQGWLGQFLPAGAAASLVHLLSTKFYLQPLPVLMLPPASPAAGTPINTDVCDLFGQFGVLGLAPFNNKVGGKDVN